MNTNTLYKITLAIGFISLSAPLLLQAQTPIQEPQAPGIERPMGPPGAEKNTPGLPPFLRGLDLSEAQEDQIFALMHEQMPAMRDQQKQRRHTMEELDALAKASNFDESKAEQLADRLSTIEKQFVLSRVRNDFRINSILTPAQRKQVEEIKAQFGKHKMREPVKFTPNASTKAGLTMI